MIGSIVLLNSVRNFMAEFKAEDIFIGIIEAFSVFSLLNLNNVGNLLQSDVSV